MKIFQGMLAAGLLASTLYPCQTQAQPAAPSELAATSVSSSEIDLTWIDNSSNELNFQLQFATNDAFSPSTKRNIGSENITSYEHTNLDPITTYWYRIKAKQGPSLSAWSNTAFATTAPDDVGATAVSSSAIDVDWTPNSTNTNVTGYTVRYSTAAGSCKDRPVAGGNGSSTYTATGLVPSTTYNVSVRADGGVANGGVYSSTFSAPANATTSPDGLSGTRISPLFFGQNAWLPLKIGIVTKGGDLEELLCGASYASDGICVTDPPAEVQASGVKLMRYGGSGVDNDYDTALSSLSPAQYLTMVDNMRANGIEPLLEVPYSDGAYGNLDESAAQAAALVHYINITHDRCVRYWTIANEPDHYVSNDRDLDPTLDSTDIAANIATYFKAYVTAMRNVDPTIVIVGPDLSFYDDGIMSELLAPGGPNEICSSYLDATGTHYYLDVVDFHNYPFSGLDPGTPGDPLDPPAEDPDQTRPNIIAYPQGGFQDKVTALAGLVKQCNDNSISPITGIISPRTGTEMLKMAVTEINIEYRNPADKTLSGVSAQSFLAGQYWADVMNVGMQNGLEFMAFWSVKEGDPLCELGYIRNNDNAKLPTYYHYQMLAQNFRGVYAAATLNGSTTNVKAFGAKDLDQIVVMLLNQNRGTAALTYTVRLNGGPINNNKALKVNINAGVAKQYNNPAGEKLAPDSTVMLVFDQNGDLLRRHVYDLNNAATGPTPPLP